MLKMWIDDVRTPPDTTWIWAMNSKDALELLDMGTYSVISFDHDLGGEDSGYVVALFIEQQAFHKSIPKLEWRVHSMNPVGRERIIRAMKNADEYWDRD
jgi:hypothetical protein